MKERATEAVWTKLTKSEKAALVAMAEQQERTVSFMVRQLVRAAVVPSPRKATAK